MRSVVAKSNSIDRPGLRGHVHFSYNTRESSHLLFEAPQAFAPHALLNPDAGLGQTLLVKI